MKRDWNWGNSLTGYGVWFYLQWWLVDHYRSRDMCREGAD